MKTSSKKYNLLLFIFSLLLFSFITTQNIGEIEFNGDEKIESYISDETSYKISINLAFSQIKNYIKISLINPVNKTYILSVFSYQDLQNRIQMDQSLSGTPKIWLKKSQAGTNKIQARVECDEAPFEFTIKIETQDFIDLNAGEQMNYHVTEENEEIKFSFKVNSAEKNLLMNIWAESALEFKTELKNVNKVEKYSNFKNFYAFKLEDQSTDVFYLNVNGIHGDFINVGSATYFDNYATVNITNNENRIKVFLREGILETACFRIELAGEISLDGMRFGTGIIDSNVVTAYYIMAGETIEPSKISFKQGFISLFIFPMTDVCFTIPKEENLKKISEVVFNFQVSLGSSGQKIANIFEPQENGQIYVRFLKKGEKMAFIGQYPGNGYKEINFNMLAIAGVPSMTVVECDNYPLCLKKGEFGKVAQPHTVNKYATYSIYKNETSGEYSPVNLNQKILMVECTNITNEAGMEMYFKSGVCFFGTLIYSDINTIYLFEDQCINQYLLKGETDCYDIDFLNQNDIKQIYVDINVYSGEVYTSFNKNDGYTYTEYYNANKIYFIVDLKSGYNFKYIDFNVTAGRNSFYTIQYSYVRANDDSSKKNTLETGNSYLITVNPRKEEETQKVVSFENPRQSEKVPFLVNFHSLNCKIDIFARRKMSDTDYLYTNLETYDYFSQDFILFENNEMAYQDSTYDYNLTVVAEDFTDYNNKRCMVYVSAIELLKTGEIFEREIVIGENTEQQIIFKKGLYAISYLYPSVEPDEDIYIRLNLIDKAEYYVFAFYEYKDNEMFSVKYSQTLVLDTNKRKIICKDKDEVCSVSIVISISGDRKSESDYEPMLEMELKTSSNSSVSYLQKNNMKIDFIPYNSTHHYYAEIGSVEETSVIVNFHRGSGKILAKLVNMSATEPNGEWRGKYNFPKNVKDSLPYDSFTKSIHFTTKLEECHEGCYLLITVYSDVEGYLKGNFTYSITVNSILKFDEYLVYQPVSILNEEYIVGNIGGVNKDAPNLVYYEVWINKDAENVLIDFQSEGAELFVIIGEPKYTPGYEKEDFKFDPNGKDTLFRMTKKELLEKGKERYPNANSIKNMILTIGVRTDVMDSLYTTVYSFMVHLDTQNGLDIHEVNSDQKTLCETTENNNNINYPNRCLFVIKPESYSNYNDLIIYANLGDNSVPYQIYANYIEVEDYESGKVANNVSLIPKADSTFSTEKNKTDYLYLSESLGDKYLLVSVVSKSKGTIELMTSFYAFNEKVTPNPSTSQLFLVKDDKLVLKFDDQELYMVYLTSIEGKAEIYWEKEPNETYYLRGREDKLSIASIDESNLVIKNLNHNKQNNGTSVFVFYISYTVKYQENFNEIYFGKSANLVFSHSYFPIILYTKLPDFSKNVNIFFSLYDIHVENYGQPLMRNNFEIAGRVINKKDILQIRSDTIMYVDESTLIRGMYDPGVRTGFLRLTTNNLTSFNSTQIEKPYLYFVISDLFKRKSKYAKVTLEITAVQENSLITTTEKVYQYGRVSQSESSVYKLRPNSLKPLMRIEFASSTNSIDFSVSTKSKDGEILKGFNSKTLNGRKIMDLDANPSKNEYIYLIVKNQNGKKEGDNFVFKYINYADKGLLKDYEIQDSKVEVTLNNNNNKTQYTIKFKAVPESEKFNVTYLIKFVTDGPKYDNNDLQETIAVKEGKSQVREFENPKIKEGNIEEIVDDIAKSPIYVEVYAEINDGSVNEFIAYKVAKLPEIQKKGSSTSNWGINATTILLIIIGIVLIAVVIVLVVLVFSFRSKNTNLMNQVNKVSFQEEDNKRENEGGLLFNDDRNTLT